MNYHLSPITFLTILDFGRDKLNAKLWDGEIESVEGVIIRAQDVFYS